MAGNAEFLVDGAVRVGIAPFPKSTAERTAADAAITAFFAKTAGEFDDELDAVAPTLVKDLGYTIAAGTLTVGKTTRAREVQQVDGPVKQRVTGRTCTFGTTFAELDIPRLAIYLDGEVVDGRLQPKSGADITEWILFLDGAGPGCDRRVVLTKSSISGDVALAWDKAADMGAPVVFTGGQPNTSDTWGQAWYLEDSAAA